ncbi:MAG: ABC transporter ATP-binding protein/permease [Acetobacteraceae bacterium]|nr:ABC transporter ATP-binding protein/permease [Acetobacteraceae bacterium]
MRAIGPFLLDAFRLARPYFNSEERWSACGLLVLIVGLRLLLVGINVVLNFWNGAFYNALQDKDWDSFISLLVFYKWNDQGFLPGFCSLAACFVLIAVYRTWFTQQLTIKWRRWMTLQLQSAWLGDRAYWHLSLRASAASSTDGQPTDNPDQRIAEDVKGFIESTLLLTLGLISAVVTLASFVAILWGLSGMLEVWDIQIPGYMVWIALVYSIIGTWVAHLVGKPLAGLRFRQQKVEADFRFALARLRENVEGIALYRGEAQESASLRTRFGALIDNWYQIMRKTKQLTSVTAVYDQTAVVFPLVIAAPRYFSGQITLGALTQTAGAFRQVEDSLSFFVHAYQELANWRATVDRLVSFQAAIDAIGRDGAGQLTTTRSPDTAWHASNLTLTLPDGRTLLHDADLTLVAGQSLLITGRSGLGKSTIFRALAGIWPYGDGTITAPAGTHMFLPQRPYLPLGTLRAAAAYPAVATAIPDDSIRSALTQVGLAHLLSRLDVEDSWSQRLSGGEQQRLAVARALLAKPDWLFLDEATSSLDPEAELELYGLLKSQLPNTTIVSIAHRQALAPLHDRRLTFTRDATGKGIVG